MRGVYVAKAACMSRRLAETDCSGLLLSRFHSAVNLFFPHFPDGTGRLITLFAPAKSLAPDSLRLSEAAFDAVRQIPVESRVSKQGSQLIWETAPFILTFGDNLTENPRIPACRPAEIRRAAAWVKNALGKPCGLDSLPRDERDGRTENLVRLADCLRRGDKAEALRRLKAGAGAGPGLTPSTDDMAVGIIAALRACGCTASFPEPEVVYAALEGRTTEVARHYIRCALEGFISETLRDALAGQAAGWKRLAETGASSGIDTITGLEIGRRVWEEQDMGGKL